MFFHQSFVSWVLSGARDNVVEWGFGALMSFLGALLALLLANWRSHQHWRSRSFEGMLNISLNTIDATTNRLLIRTVLEASLDDVFINPVAVKMVQSACQLTTEQRALLTWSDRRDAWFILNLVLNAVSERFADGFLKRDLGVLVTSHEYILCMTFERGAQKVRAQKPRALLIRRDVLEGLSPDSPPLCETPEHRIRWEALLAMKKDWRERGCNSISLELCW